jgi:5-methyltetrahydrofolate--homocysteine methyltransferase
MILIGEKINATTKIVREALAKKDEKTIASLITAQREAGAQYIDLNAATSPEEESTHFKWLLNIADGLGVNALSLDSANPRVLEEMLALCRGKDIIVNSTTMEKARYEAIFPLVKQYTTKLIVLALDDEGLPHDAEQRYKIAARAKEKAREFGIAPEALFIDPLVRPLSTEQSQGMQVLEAIALIKNKLSLKTVFGVSNISFGLPKRSIVNRTFLSLAIFYGLDAVIADPLDNFLLSSIAASRVITGQDQFCLDYIARFKKGLLH